MTTCLNIVPTINLMPITLHNHQQVWVDKIKIALGRCKSVLGQAPTGFGKSDTRIINKVVYSSYGALAVLLYLTVHTSNFMSNKSIELAILQDKINRAHELQAAKLVILHLMDIKVTKG